MVATRLLPGAASSPVEVLAALQKKVTTTAPVAKTNDTGRKAPQVGAGAGKDVWAKQPVGREFKVRLERDEYTGGLGIMLDHFHGEATITLIEVGGSAERMRSLKVRVRSSGIPKVRVGNIVRSMQ